MPDRAFDSENRMLRISFFSVGCDMAVCHEKTPDNALDNGFITGINAKLKMHKIAHSKCTKKIR